MEKISTGIELPDVAGLEFIKAKLGRLSHLSEALDLAAGMRHRLGEMLYKAGRLSHEQLDAAIEEQRRSGEPLGQILVQNGWLQLAELEAVLEFQRRQAGDVPTTGPLKLGELLVATGQIKREQLAQSLFRQKISGKRLGEELIEAGHVLPHQIAGALHLQQKLVTAALVAILAISTATAPLTAAAEGSARVGVSATVLKYTNVHVLKQPASVVITAGDTARGYVDVPAASQIEIDSNNPDGYMLVFESQSEIVSQTRVQGLSGEVRLGPAGGMVMQATPGMGRVKNTVSLGFRFELDQNARPGIYAWPMQLSVMPL